MSALNLNESTYRKNDAIGVRVRMVPVDAFGDVLHVGDYVCHHADGNPVGDYHQIVRFGCLSRIEVKNHETGEMSVWDLAYEIVMKHVR